MITLVIFDVNAGRSGLDVHRSAIVRVDMVAELRALTNRDAMLRLRDGTLLRASRTYMPALAEALAARTRPQAALLVPSITPSIA